MIGDAKQRRSSGVIHAESTSIVDVQVGIFDGVIEKVGDGDAQAFRVAHTLEAASS